MEFKLPDFKTVIDIHEIVIEFYGGLGGIPHPNLIEAALHRPETYMNYDDHCDIHLVAALILESIARNHAFADGNKRTALLTMLMTYNNNKIRLSYGLHLNEKFEVLVLDVATKKLTIIQIRSRLQKLVEEFSQ